MQTYKIKPFPVVLFDFSYWQGLLDWLRNSTLSKGYISEKDLGLLRVCDSPEEVAEAVSNWYQKQKLSGRQALSLNQ
jgi:predicted Rossmann-fold nucleotide-binding protein